MRRTLTIMIFIMWSILSFSYINISPTTLDKNIQLGAYEEFTFTNNTTIPMRYRITPMAMKNANVKDMSEWIEVYPKVVTVYPDDSQTFKLYVEAPKNSETGDYGAFLNIKQVSAPKLEGETKDHNITAGMMVMVNVDMGIYGYIGDKNPELETTEPKVVKNKKEQKLQLEVKNKTNRLVKMKVEVKTDKNYFYQVGNTRAFKGQTIVFDHPIKDMKLDENPKEILITDVETKKVIKKLKIK